MIPIGFIAEYEISILVVFQVSLDKKISQRYTVKKRDGEVVFENNWDNINSNIFNVKGITNKANADKLFVNLLMQVEKQGINIHKEFTIDEISKLIPRGTAGIINYSTYAYSFLSMLSNQSNRDFFIYTRNALRDEFTVQSNNPKRNNNYWKDYLNEKLKINPIYINV